MVDPVFSVIIPSYNRGPIVQKCLEALAAQTLPPGLFEVIVSDDGSQDDTPARVAALRGGMPFTLEYLQQPNSGANRARNRAIRQARGRLLVVINDDTIAVPSFLAEHLMSHEAHPQENVAVLGRVTISPELPYSFFAQLHLDATYATFEGQTQLDWRAFFTCNISLKRSFLRGEDAFEEGMRWHEDLELGERLARRGLAVVYNPAALGHHDHFLEERDYLGIAGKEGRSLVQWYRKAPHLKGELAGLGFYPALPWSRRVRYGLADLMFSPVTIPLLTRLARFFVRRRESVALALYRKIFQALKRRGIRAELAGA